MAEVTSARHLDDPLRPFAGLSVGQVLALCLGAGAAYGCYRVVSHLPAGNGMLAEAAIFLVAAVGVGVTGLGWLLLGTRGEPFGAQCLAWARRRHRYAPPAPRRRSQWLRPAPSVRLLPFNKQAPLVLDEDGTLTLPDGEPRRCLAVEPVNFDCCSDVEREQFALTFARLAGLLQPGGTLQLLIESRPLAAGPLLDHMRAQLRPASPVVAELARTTTTWWRGQLQRAHVPDLRFTLVLSPGPERLRRVGRPQPRTPDAARRSLEEMARLAQDTLKRGRVRARPLSREETARLLWEGLHPGGAAMPSLATLSRGQNNDPENRVHIPLERLADTTAQEGADVLALDGIYARTFFLLAPPDVCAPGWLDRLVGLDCPARIALHLEGTDRGGERARLLRRRRALHAISTEQDRGAGIADLDTTSAGGEAATVARLLADPSQTMPRWSLYLTVFGASRAQLDEHATRALTLLTGELGCTAGQALFHQLPAWQSTLPLGIDPAQRRYRALSATVGTAFPFLTHNPGMTSGILLGTTAATRQPVFLDPFDPALPNAVINAVGGSGSGKTYVSQLLAEQMHLRGARVTIIDRSPGHYSALCALLGGTEVRLGAPEPPSLNIWDWDGEISRDKLAFVADAHAVLLGDTLDALERAILERGIRAVYARHAAHGTTPLEREFVAWLQDEGAQTPDPAERERVRHLAVTLAPYVGEGRYAALVDRPTSVDQSSRFLVWNLDGMDEGLLAFELFRIAESVQRRVTARVDEHARELLVIDEGYFLITSGGPARRWLDHLARRSRHYGLCLLFITQQLSDLLDDATAASLFNNASIQLLFRQDDQRNQAGRSAVDRLAAVLSLSDGEVRRLRGLATVAGVSTEVYLLCRRKDLHTAQRGVVEVTAHPIEHALFASQVAEVATRERYIAARGGDLWKGLCAMAAGEEETPSEDVHTMERIAVLRKGQQVRLPRTPRQLRRKQA